MKDIKEKRKGKYGHKHSESTKQLLREKRLAQKDPRLGKKHSEETKKKMSLAHIGQVHIGKPHTDETKKKLSEQLRKRWADPKQRVNLSKINLGRTLSQDHKDKITEFNKQRWQDPQYREHMKINGHIPTTLGTTQSPETIAKRMHTMKPIFESSIYKSKLREKRLHQVFPQKDSKPELKLQLALDLAKIKYTKHHPIIGQPDIFIQPNIAIFLDGCYFHGCVACKGERVLTDLIPQKAIANDQIVNSDLRKKGIIVIRIWEHEINNNETAVIDLIKVRVGIPVGSINELDKEVKS